MFSTPILAIFLALVGTITAAPSPAPSLANAPVVKVKTYTSEQLIPFLGKTNPGHAINSTISARDSDSELSSRGIIGTDNRVLWTSQDYPYSAIGRISFSSGWKCSGVLVGRRHVATSRNCIPTSDTWGARFAPSYYDGERLGGSNIIAAITLPFVAFPPCGYKDDWAILVLADPIGNERGWFGSKEVYCPGQKNTNNWVGSCSSLVFVFLSVVLELALLTVWLRNIVPHGLAKRQEQREQTLPPGGCESLDL